MAGPQPIGLMTLITADWVIAEPGEEPLRNAAVRVEGSRITAIGNAAALRGEFPGDHIVDGTGCVLAPGFVNTHAHLYGVLAHGIPLAAPHSANNSASRRRSAGAMSASTNTTPPRTPPSAK